jgi:predicted secreted protein
LQLKAKRADHESALFIGTMAELVEARHVPAFDRLRLRWEFRHGSKSLTMSFTICSRGILAAFTLQNYKDGLVIE